LAKARQSDQPANSLMPSRYDRWICCRARHKSALKGHGSRNVPQSRKK
jgi:hypothetical protein